MEKTPFNFYDQFIWDGLKGCTRCGKIFDNMKEMKQHCRNQSCKNVDSSKIDWMR